jgi:hypothetical protein
VNIKQYAYLEAPGTKHLWFIVDVVWNAMWEDFALVAATGGFIEIINPAIKLLLDPGNRKPSEEETAKKGCEDGHNQDDRYG